MEGLTQIVGHLVGIPQILHAEADDIHKVLHQSKELLGVGTHLGWGKVEEWKLGEVPVPSLVLLPPSLLCCLFFLGPMGHSLAKQGSRLLTSECPFAFYPQAQRPRAAAGHTHRCSYAVGRKSVQIFTMRVTALGLV